MLGNAGSEKLELKGNAHHVNETFDVGNLLMSGSKWRAKKSKGRERERERERGERENSKTQTEYESRTSKKEDIINTDGLIS